MSGVRDETNAVRDLLVDSVTGALVVSGGVGGGGAATIADGADVAEGARADAAVTDPAASGSLIALLKGLITLWRNAAPTSISGTVTTGGTAQDAAAANSARRGFWIQNNSSGDLWISTIAAAVQSQPSLKLPPGAYYESPLGGAGTGAISIIGATTGQAYSGRQW